MANPPITIPPLTNVPAPGSAIQSAWAQDITTYATTRLIRAFPTVAALKAWVPADANAIGLITEDNSRSVCTRAGNSWACDRVVVGNATTDGTGMFAITAASVGFASIVHADAITNLAFPGGGQISHVPYLRLLSNTVQIHLRTMPSFAPEVSTAFSYTARIRGLL